MNRFYVLAIAIGLSGCGGGGGGSSSSSSGSGTDSVPPAPRGVDQAAVAVYKATVRGGPLPIFQTLVVGPTGRSAIYYADGFDSSRGFVDASINGTGGLLTATLTDFAQTGIFTGSASGTYRAGSGVSANVIYPGQAYTIDFLFSSYPTDPTGPLSAVGVWSSRDEKGGTQSITIAGGRSGTFAVSYSNAFQVATLTGSATGNGCRFGTGSMSGLLLISAPGTKNPSIVGHLVRSDLKEGFMFSSYRCSDGSTRTVAPVFQC